MSGILQLIIALSALIILHEIGHFIAARLSKVDVEEFGLGFPPRAMRLWRGKSRFKLGSTEITVPVGRRLIQDLETGQWADIITKPKEQSYSLQNIQILEATTEPLKPKRETRSDGLVHMRGEITAVKTNTLYSLNWLPLGGFVRLKGETEPDDPRGLHAASPWARLMIYAAGPMMNVFAGVLIYAFMVMQTGAPDLSTVLIVETAPNSPAAQVGLQGGDIITSADGEKIDSMNKLHETIYANLGEPIKLTFQRGEQSYDASITPRENPPEGEGAIGIMMSNPREPVGWLEAIPIGAQATYNHALLLLTLPGQVVRGAIDPELARPVGYKGMYDIYQEVREREAPIPDSPINLNVMQFYATITISLAVLNLLPIPALDGGRILFTLPEIIFRRRIPVRWQNIINMISISAMILLFIYINILDFTNPVNLPK